MDLVKGVHLEFSLVELYKGQKVMLELMNKMDEYGFRPHYFMPHNTVDENGSMLQIDGVFFRK